LAFQQLLTNRHALLLLPWVALFGLQVFYVGTNYLEVDLDVHNYAFLARKALWSYHDRLRTVVWENAFVIQASRRLPPMMLSIHLPAIFVSRWSDDPAIYCCMPLHQLRSTHHQPQC